MSKENLERFMTQVADSEDLQAKIGEEITGDALVALGAAHGCEFSAEDLAADAELSDQELDGVAGGSVNGGAGNAFLKSPRGRFGLFSPQQMPGDYSLKSPNPKSS
jgi:predicted ribosomally synthesized peptide with nif11-like leader